MTKPAHRPALRLYVRETLVQNSRIELSSEQCHYLFKVMRRSTGDIIGLFNGHSGEWQARLDQTGKKTAFAYLEQEILPPLPETKRSLTLYFSPLKRSQTELIVQKATELGATALIPVITDHTRGDHSRIKRSERLESIAVEACEQCERLEPPDIGSPIRLEELLSNSLISNPLLVAAEAGNHPSLPSVLSSITESIHKMSILVGPEGGFSARELDKIGTCRFAYLAGLGPRIMKAETAAIAALSVVQALWGDWDIPPGFRE